MTCVAVADSGLGKAAERNSQMGTTRRMSARQLKALIQTGHYRMEPELVAEAMLERPGVRALLGRDVNVARPADRSPAVESHVRWDR
jgi:hypothetical protein